MSEINEKNLKPTFSLFIWVFHFALSSGPSSELQEDVFIHTYNQHRVIPER